jgi:hypothetical protein
MSMHAEVSVVLSLPSLELCVAPVSDVVSPLVDSAVAVGVSPVVALDVDAVSELAAPVSSVVNGTVVFSPSFDVTSTVVDVVEPSSPLVSPSGVALPHADANITAIIQG